MAAVAGSSRDAYPPASPEPFPKSLKGRLRSSIETSIRHATRSKTRSTVPAAEDEHGRSPAASKIKGKHPAAAGAASSSASPGPADDVRPTKTPMLKRLESRVSSFRPSAAKQPTDAQRDRPSGFQIPSLRGASMSDPTLTLSAHTHRPRPALLAGVMTDVFAPISHAPPPAPAPRSSKRSSLQPAPSLSGRDISGPSPLRRSGDAPRVLNTHRDPARSSVDLPRTSARSPEPPSRSAAPEATRKSKPPPLYPTVAAPSSPPHGAASPTSTPTRRTRDLPSEPPTPTPAAGSKTIGNMRKGSSSSSALPLSPRATSPPSPIGDRNASPALLPARSPSTRRPVAPARGLSSASASHLPMGSSARRPSLEAASRPSGLEPQPRRPSLDARPSASSYRSDSPSTSRAASPRGTTPSPIPGAHHPGLRVRNASSSSIATTSSPEHRDLIRAAASLLCRELSRNTSQLRRNSEQDFEEVEVRMRNLVRLERIWGKSGAGGVANSGGSSATGEERERRAFTEALRDGYVLCQFMNKLRPGSLANPSTRDDGFVRTSNITRFLATCSIQGVPSEDLFQRDDLIEASAESLARVARAVLSLFRITEAPAADRSRGVSSGGGNSNRGPYGSSRAAESTPNIALARSTSPTMSTPVQKKRWSPPTAGLPTVMDSGLDTLRENLGSRPTTGESDQLSPLGMTPPPRSPLRTRSSNSRAGLFNDRGSLADSTRASLGESVRERESIADSRRSLASSTRTDTTAFSSLLEVQRSRSGSGSAGQYGTIRTMTTDATSLHVNDDGSLAPSLTDDLGRKSQDLHRVVEETESSATSSSGGKKKARSSANASAVTARLTPTMAELAHEEEVQEKERERRRRIHLGKAKWPDDFLDTSQQSVHAAALAEEFGTDGSVTPPLSSSPPQMDIVAPTRTSMDRADVQTPPLLTPKRPSHRARHSVDTTVLLPRPPRLRTETDNSSPTRSPLRRSNTQAAPRSPGLLPRSDWGARSDSQERATRSPRVPFPRSVSGEYSIHDHSPARTSAADRDDIDLGSVANRPKVPRGRFTSEVDGASSRRRPRPNSFDIQGSKPGRSRFESMVNLGVVSSNPNASDINSRDSVDIRQTLIVKEEGKPAVQYQLGNCVGRGQFGSVYRALNLTTGQMVAVKRIRLEGLKEEEIKQLMREVDLVKSLSHPSIVKYEGMSRDDSSLSIVLEFAENGSLGQTLKAFGKLNERLVASYVVKILDGLHYLHQCHVVHCDLKAANILTTKTGNVKLSDFGVSLNLRNLRAMEKERKDVAGTPNWMAPEVIELKGASYASDIWSLACTVIELLTGRPPYADIPNSMSVMFRIVEDDTPPLPEGCSEFLEDFLRQCFNKDPSKRPTAEELCEHEWLKQNWEAGKELRQQDSIPFLRRVSTDVQQKSPAVARYLGQADFPSKSDGGSSDESPRSPTKRNSNATSAGRAPFMDSDSIMAPREHSFVKTAFGKPMTCRVCMQSVKKSAVICAECSLIAHQKCAMHAPLTCDLRAQFLMYAESNNGLAQAADHFAAAQARSVGSSPPTEGGVPSPRTSFDVQSSGGASSSPYLLHPPTAFKAMSPFKRSRSSLSTPEPAGPPPATSDDQSSPIPIRARRRSVLKRSQASHERPASIASISTGQTPNSSSMRSALTAAESFSSHGGRESIMTTTDAEHGRLSHLSAPEGAQSRSSRFTTASSAVGDAREAGVPGAMPVASDQPRLRRRDKSSDRNCVVQ